MILGLQKNLGHKSVKKSKNGEKQGAISYLYY